MLKQGRKSVKLKPVYPDGIKPENITKLSQAFSLKFIIPQVKLEQIKSSTALTKEEGTPSDSKEFELQQASSSKTKWDKLPTSESQQLVRIQDRSRNDFSVSLMRTKIESVMPSLFQTPNEGTEEFDNCEYNLKPAEILLPKPAEAPKVTTGTIQIEVDMSETAHSPRRVSNQFKTSVAAKKTSGVRRIKTEGRASFNLVDSESREEFKEESEIRRTLNKASTGKQQHPRSVSISKGILKARSNLTDRSSLSRTIDHHRKDSARKVMFSQQNQVFSIPPRTSVQPPQQQLEDEAFSKPKMLAVSIRQFTSNKIKALHL